MLLGEALQLRAAQHRAVLRGQFAQRTGGLEARQPRQIHGGLGVPAALEHALGAGAQRKHMAGTRECPGTELGVRERANGVRALLGGDARGGARGRVDADGELRTLRLVVVLRDHQRQRQRLAARASAPRTPRRSYAAG
jgi:hypothetical protein